MLKPLKIHICGQENVTSEIDSIDLIYQQTSGSIFINKFPISEYFKSSDSLCPITSYALV